MSNEWTFYLGQDEVTEILRASGVKAHFSNTLYKLLFYCYQSLALAVRSILFVLVLKRTRRLESPSSAA